MSHIDDNDGRSDWRENNSNNKNFKSKSEKKKLKIHIDNANITFDNQ